MTLEVASSSIHHQCKFVLPSPIELYPQVTFKKICRFDIVRWHFLLDLCRLVQLDGDPGGSTAVRQARSFPKALVGLGAGHCLCLRGPFSTRPCWNAEKHVGFSSWWLYCVYIYIHIHVYLSIYRTIYLSIYLAIYLSIYLSLFLSFSLSLYIYTYT